MKAGSYLAAATLLMLASQPAAARELHYGSTDIPTATSGFVGVHLRMPVGTSSSTPKARLALGLTQNSGDGSPFRIRPSSALELGLSERGRAEFYVGRQRLRSAERKLRISSESTAAIALASIAAITAAVLLLKHDDDDDREVVCMSAIEVCPPLSAN